MDDQEKATVMVEVRVVRRDGKSVLVEWDGPDSPQRAVIPGKALKGTAVSEADLAAGVPYGAPWAKLVSPSVTPAAIEDGLRRAGIWTVEELRHNTQQAVSVLQGLYSVDLATLLRAARQYETNDGGK